MKTLRDELCTCENCTVPLMADKKNLRQLCGICLTQKLVSGKWKLYLLLVLGSGTKRFNELHKLTPGITQTMLTKQLRELENDGLVHRHVYQEVPPKVEYSLTEQGESFIPVIETMAEWGASQSSTDINEVEKRVKDSF